MKTRQNVKHFAFRKSLELPVVGEKTHEKLVDTHVGIFADKVDPDRRKERLDHLHGFFDGTIDMYLAAIQASSAETTAHEMTHIVANFDFYNRGWVEMMEFPADELGEHYNRYADFFERYAVSLNDPLGEFRPGGGVTDAPATPDRLDKASTRTRMPGTRTTSTSRTPLARSTRAVRRPPTRTPMTRPPESRTLGMSRPVR